jgi:hypothetical protein
MSASIRARLRAIEKSMGASDGKMCGVIELEINQTPLEGLAGAGVGYWLILDAGEKGYLGEVRLDGTREVHHAIE